MTSSNKNQADRKRKTMTRLLSFAVRSWMHWGWSGLQRRRAKWLAVDTIIVWELLTCRAEQQVATLLLLTSLSHCNQRGIHKEGCSSYCTPPGHHVQSRCQHVCVCVRQSLCHAAATLKSILGGVFMFVDTYEHVPMSMGTSTLWQDQPEGKCRAGKMSSPLLVSVSLLRTPLTPGLIASIKSAPVALNHISIRTNIKIRRPRTSSTNSMTLGAVPHDWFYLTFKLKLKEFMSLNVRETIKTSFRNIIRCSFLWTRWWVNLGKNVSTGHLNVKLRDAETG